MPRIKDIAGQRFGRLTVIREDGRSPGWAVLWLCVCDCGTTTRVQGRRLRDGTTASCGCYHREQQADAASRLMRGKPNINRMDLARQRFGRWAVISSEPDTTTGHAHWLCRCDCGVERSVRGSCLRGGQSTSCGCESAERLSQWIRGKTPAESAMWKGEAASYGAKHQRVQRAKGRPRRCEACGLDDPTVFYDWANLTGNYDDVNDYRRMCRPCHAKYDSARRRRARACRLVGSQTEMEL